jgi:ribonuclease HI
MHTTPTAALEMAVGLLPLDLWIRRCAALTAARVLRKDNNVGSSGHCKIWGEVSNHTTAHMPSDTMVSKHVFGKLFRVIITGRHNGDYKNPSYLRDDDMMIFTDGSVCHDLAGAGLYMPNPEVKLSVSLGRYATVFQAETAAILKAALFAKEINCRDRRICIFSDSQAALKAIDSNTVSSKLVLETIIALNRLSSLNEVRLYWIPSHMGIKGNVQADKLARLGAASTFVGPEPALGTTLLSLKRDINNHFSGLHQERWDNLISCRLSKIFFGTINQQRTKLLLNHDRGTLRVLLGILTGHCPLNRHMFRMKIRNSPECEQCGEGEEETVEHFLCSCPSYSLHRLHCFGSQSLFEDQLSTLRIPDILAFIRRTNRFRD